LLEGANNSSGQPFAAIVSDLVSKGVQFNVCNNTLTTRNISVDKVLVECKGGAMGRGRGVQAAGPRKFFLPAPLSWALISQSEECL